MARHQDCLEFVENVRQPTLLPPGNVLPFSLYNEKAQRTKLQCSTTLRYIEDFGKFFHSDINSLMASTPASCVLRRVLLDK